jgi:hypothetical protein
MRKQMDIIRQEWEGLRKVKSRVQQDFQQWKSLEKKCAALFEQISQELGWEAEIKLLDQLPESREIRITLHNIFPLGEKLVAYNNNAALIFEQRLSGQVFVWHLFPQKEHFSRLEGPQARPAGQFKIEQLIQDELLILLQIENFLARLKGWMLEVLPEPAEEKTAQEY